MDGRRDTQGNPGLWDLVYNGVLHSVVSGNCDLDAETRRILKPLTSAGEGAGRRGVARGGYRDGP